MSGNIPISDYLGSQYDPDCDYVEGVLIERNAGEKSHSKLQKALLLALSRLENPLGIFVIQEQRVQVAAER